MRYARTVEGGFARNVQMLLHVRHGQSEEMAMETSEDVNTKQCIIDTFPTKKHNVTVTEPPT